MTKERIVSLEAQALERIVRAARQVYAASDALQANFGEEETRQPSALELVRLAAAVEELQEAREMFDMLVSEKQRNESRVDSTAASQ